MNTTSRYSPSPTRTSPVATFPFLPLLPAHILAQIYILLPYAHSHNKQITQVLRINREICDVVGRDLYRDVKIDGLERLERFVRGGRGRKWGGGTSSISITIPGGELSPSLSTTLGKTMEMIPNVQEVNFTLYTLRVDPARDDLIRGMRKINPTRFTWISPDPDHQFIIAIFSSYLPLFLSSYANLTHLSLSNISFHPLNDPARGEGGTNSTGSGIEGVNWINTFRLPREVKRKLKRVEIRRAIFLDPRIVLELLDMENRVGRGEGTSSKDSDGIVSSERLMRKMDEEHEEDGLRLILEDVYLESIWGPRMRFSDLMEAAAKHDIPLSLLDRVEIRSRFERIQGGDRMDG